MVMTSQDSTHDVVESNLIPPVATPHWGSQSGGAFTIRAKTTINAPVDVVLDTLLDTTTWPQWNDFVLKADLATEDGRVVTDGRLRPGIAFTEYVDMKGRGKPALKMKLNMTTLDDLRDCRSGVKAVWLGKGYPDWALRSERVHEIYNRSDGVGTVYDVYETFSGPLAYLVKLFVGKALVARFGQWNKELKEYVEKG